MYEIDRKQARRLALLRAGLLKPSWTGLPRRSGRGERAAHQIIDRFGYLQLDTVSVSGARSHALVLLSRLEGLDPALPEGLLREGSPLFEYWGHEACWMPMELYPAFAFRRVAFRRHPWWNDILGENPELADRLLRRIEDEGPLRSVDLEGGSSEGWWGWKLSKKVAAALWSSGELAIGQRVGFQRTFDLSERVIPGSLRGAPLALEDALPLLLERALAGHGWATESTLRGTWRLRRCGPAVRAALARLEGEGRAVRCALIDGDSRARGWIRPDDLEGLDALGRLRPRRDRGVLLSPFDPLLWDRARVQLLFGFEQLLEIFKPAAQRRWGYYCLPVLAGEALVARVDLKADRRAKTLRVLSRHHEAGHGAAGRAATDFALQRQARQLGLRLEG